MVYIISEEEDLTTHIVIEWLLEKIIPFVRVSDLAIGKASIRVGENLNLLIYERH